MQIDRVLILSVTSLPLLAMRGTGSDTIAFAPEAESTVTKVFRTELETSLSDVSVLVGGADPGVPEFTIDTSWLRKVKVTDEYVATKDGRPTELVRTYDEIAYELECEMTVDEEGNTGEGSGGGTSALAGKKIRFAWDDGDEDYVKSFVDDEGDSELLEGLVEDMDLRALLPDDDVEPDAEWEIDAARFLATIVPGGDLSIEMDLDPPEGDPRFPVVGIDPRTSADLADFLGGEATGEATAKYTGTREEDGRKLAVIEIRADVESTQDAADTMVERWGDDPTGEGLAVTMGGATFKLELEGEGELLWDVGAGRLASWRFGGDIHLTLEEKFTVDADGEQVPVEATLELEGKLGQEVVTE